MTDLSLKEAHEKASARVIALLPHPGRGPLHDTFLQNWTALCSEYRRAMRSMGYGFMPLEATEEMIQAADKARLPEEVWSAMAAAAEKMEG